MNILEQLAEHAVYRTEQAKKQVPLDAIKERALSSTKGDFIFEKALRNQAFLLSANVRRLPLPKD